MPRSRDARQCAALTRCSAHLTLGPPSSSMANCREPVKFGRYISACALRCFAQELLMMVVVVVRYATVQGASEAVKHKKR